MTFLADPINSIMKKVVVMPGRFQPMLQHHVQVLSNLQTEFPDADVYVGTSDKVDPPKSPFNFSEKRQIAQAHGIRPDRVLAVKRPYDGTNYPFDPDSTVLIFAVGEKDAAERFPQRNVDPETGLSMTVRNPRPAYIQRLGVDDQLLPMSERAYVYVTPNIKNNGEVSSASAFRKSLQDAPDTETAKRLYTKQFGEFDHQTFELIYNRLTKDTTMENLNTLRKLAGLPIMESAPVAYNMTDQESRLAKIGRALMAQAESADPEESGEMGMVGHELTKFGTTHGAGSVEELLSKTGISADRMRELLAMGQQGADAGAGQMGIDRAEEPEGFEDDDDYEMESLDLSDIAEEYDLDESEEDLEESDCDDDDLEEGAKPDFLDLDDDGDEEESMKQAAKDAEEVEESAMTELRKLAGL